MTKPHLIEIHELESETATKEQLSNQADPESQVVVHCYYTNNWLDMRMCIRIWKSTFLFSRDSDHVSPLVISENISLYPEWTTLLPYEERVFTLIFSGLPKSCKSFDLIEKIPEPGGFCYPNIIRNETDIYHIDIN